MAFDLNAAKTSFRNLGYADNSDEMKALLGSGAVMNSAGDQPKPLNLTTKLGNRADEMGEQRASAAWQVFQSGNPGAATRLAPISDPYARWDAMYCGEKSPLLRYGVWTARVRRKILRAI